MVRGGVSVLLADCDQPSVITGSCLSRVNVCFCRLVGQSHIQLGVFGQGQRLQNGAQRAAVLAVSPTVF